MKAFTAPQTSIGALDAACAGRMAAAAADVALVVDADGIVVDVAYGSDDLGRYGCADWVGRPWLETVTVESRPKVEALLRDAAGDAAARWRHINHPARGRCRAARKAAARSPSGATCAAPSRCSSAWSTRNRPWSATTGSSATRRRATGTCSRWPRRPSSCSTA